MDSGVLEVTDEAVSRGKSLRGVCVCDGDGKRKRREKKRGSESKT